MDIIKRLPSQLAQYVFSFDDTYSNLYRVVIIQLMYYNLFNSNKISTLNKYQPTKHTLNKKGKITNSIKKFIQDTNDQFDINEINVFRKELPNLYTVLKRLPPGTGEKLFNPSQFVMFCDYRDYLSYKKYSCVNHDFEFCGSNKNYLYNRLMILALILNGHPYKLIEARYSNLSINAHFTKFRQHMYQVYDQCSHDNKCKCRRSKL